MAETMLDPAAAAIVPPGHYGRDDTTGLRVRIVAGRVVVQVTARGRTVDALKETVTSKYAVALPDNPVIAQGPRVSFLWSGYRTWMAMAAEDVDSGSGSRFAFDVALDVVALTIAEYIPRQVMRLQQLLGGFPPRWRRRWRRRRRRAAAEPAPPRARAGALNGGGGPPGGDHGGGGGAGGGVLASFFFF